MTDPAIIKVFTAGPGGVRQFRLVQPGASDGLVIESTAVANFIFGVSCQPGTAAEGQRADIVLAGTADVEAGGNVARGALVTTDSQGRAVTASPAAGANNRILGIALVGAASGDIFQVLLAQGSVQG